MPPSKRTVPPVLLLSSMPPLPPLAVMFPLKSTVPLVRPDTRTSVETDPATARLSVAPMVTSPEPLAIWTPMPSGASVAPTLPPLMVTLPAASTILTPTPKGPDWPSMVTLPMVSEPEVLPKVNARGVTAAGR